MSMRHFLTAAFCLLAFSASAQNTMGFYIDGNKLHEFCTTNYTMAHGYVSGVFDRSSTAYAATLSPSVMLCSPQSSKTTQLTDVVCKYLEENPEVRHYGGAAITEMALTEAFPCPAP